MTGERIRLSGFMVMAGGVLWGAGMLAAGPLDEFELNRIELAGSLLWQVGVLALLAVMATTRATGTGRLGRSLLAVTTTLVLLAMAWTVGALVDPELDNSGIWAALDAAWPLGMLFLFFVAISQWCSHASGPDEPAGRLSSQSCGLR